MSLQAFTSTDTVILATRNQGKVKELEEPLRAFGIRIVGLDAFPELPEVEETGTTFEENARLKAETVARLTGLVAIADDSGLEVDALGGAPGVYSARYSDDRPDIAGASRDAKNITKLLEALVNVPEAVRTARFRSVIIACTPEGQSLVTAGAWEGIIATAPQGTNGFGYDPVFYDPESGRTAAELTREEKTARSHRGQAMRALLEQWEDFWEKVQRGKAV